MFVLSGICLVLLIALFVVLIYQLAKQQKLNQIRSNKNTPPHLLEKLSLYEKIEEQKQKKYNQYTFLSIVTTLFLVVATVILISSKFSYTKNQVQQLEEEVHTLKVEQKQLISKMPVQQYSEDGIGLKELAWEKIVDKETDNKAQVELETEIASKMGPYFGISRVLTNVERSSKTLSISLISSTQEEENKKLISRNIQYFVQEAESIPQLMKIHIKVLTAEGKKNSALIDETYSREEADNPFTVQK